MGLPTQRIAAGRLEQPYRQEWNRLQAAQAIPKIWAGNAALWKDDDASAKVITHRLGWIPVLDWARPQTGELEKFAKETMSRFSDIVLLGMGGSSLAPEVLSLTFPAPGSELGKKARFFVLDTTDPEGLAGVTAAIDLTRTLFVVASKSGKTIETLSLFYYFEEKARQAGVREPHRQFIAITDAGSYLDQLGNEQKFLQVFRNPADIGGRYSALSYFGLVPAALWGIDIGALLDSAMAMRDACGPQADAATNPALALAAFLAAAAKEGRDKLVLLSTPELVPLGNWIEQLVAESTGKEDKGIVPVAGGASPPLEVLEQACAGVALQFEGRNDAALEEKLQQLERDGWPVVRIVLPDPMALGAEFFKWEVATAAAGAALGIDPFDEPNVQESKDNTERILQQFQESGQMPVGSAQLTEFGLTLYLDGILRDTVSTLNLPGALRTFFAERRPDDYVAVLAYVDRDAEDAEELEPLRALLSERLELPVLIGYGPRYMHSIGQLFKGGPPSGMFLVLTSEKKVDAAIPGTKYTFGQLQMAQALGDLQSLLRRDKPALRLHLTQGVPAGLAQLRKVCDQALRVSRPAAG